MNNDDRLDSIEAKLALTATWVGDIKDCLDRIEKKIDALAVSSCNHARTVAANEIGAPVICQDCGERVGTVKTKI